ncbi:MAG: hypothetical protein HY820_20495 [Acidobacteria bacterium]|nr:hypothetical protein [Acidobacteriota bacterium]
MLWAVPAQAQGPIRAGAFAADITPQAHMWPISRVGNFEPSPATGAHDPLSARALVLEAGRTKLAIVIIDSVGVSAPILDEAKRLASAATGIPVERILMAATHTHSAPAAGNDVYRPFLIARIADAVKQAASRLQPAEIGWGSAQVPEHLFNRRWLMKEGSIPPNPFGERGEKARMNPPRGSPDLIGPAGPTDPEVSIVSVRSAAGRPLALLANYSLHYVGYIPAGQVSADYFGEFARQIRDRVAPGEAGSDFVGILSNGTSGDVNNTNWKVQDKELPPFVKVRQVAARVADAVFASYQTIKHQSKADLAMAEKELTLRLRKPTEAQLKFARAALEPKDGKALPARDRFYVNSAIRMAEGPDTIAVKLQALRVGNFGLVAIPFEVFTEIGLEIKKRSPIKPVFTIELANGANGYLPTPEQHALGGYETWLGTNRVEIEASRKITETLLDLLRAVSPRQ